tara:strand:- start:696 stop:926 length:231 start_codon:yes stop_codon:yes gene_type:complete
MINVHPYMGRSFLNIYMNKSNQLRQLLKDHLGCTRDETVDFIWNQLASQNVKMDLENKQTVLAKGNHMFQELLKDW